MTNTALEKAVEKLPESWKAELDAEFQQPYFHALDDFLMDQERLGKTIFPPQEHWFNAFNAVEFDQVKVVILGQDPYHGLGQAHGLCFSVQPGTRIPPSLRNIFKQLHAEYDQPIPENGCLQRWAQQGVLLLNATLTVEQGKAGSHQGQGWEQFTDAVIQRLNEHRRGLVFLLWGSYAQNKGRLIDDSKHLILRASHPSPLSAHRGFLGCGHFTKANTYLEENGQPGISW
ncbi:MAG: uracil-DNA glycosylase [Spongiibacteraceae bacterium]